MITGIRVRVVGNNNISNKPNIGDTYTLVFIKGNHLAECLGNENTSKYHIYENGELFGNLKADPHLKNTKIKNQIEELDLGKIVKVGLFKVAKIILLGKGNCAFSIHGDPVLHDKLLFDNETDKWQKNLDSTIQKYGWSKYIEEEKQYLEIKKKEKFKIEKEGWDSLKPLTKYNHPPNMNYPPDMWGNISLEISKNNKTDYKCIILCSGNIPSQGQKFGFGTYYFKKDKYKNSEMYESPVIAAYNYALWKIENKQIKEKEQKMNELYPNKRYIYCPFEEKDKCKFNGGKWDNDKKLWYIPEGIDIEPFKNWFYQYENKENYIEKQILYWFFRRYFTFPDFETAFGDVGVVGDVGLGKWLIFIDIGSTNYDKLEYLYKKVGVTGFKIWQDGREEVKKNFGENQACICIYCGWKSKSFEEQKKWIKYIGFNISKDCYLKSISKKNKIFFKSNQDTHKYNYSFNSKSCSKLVFNFN